MAIDDSIVCCSIYSTHNAVNCTRLHLVQLILVLLIPNTTANCAITYTNWLQDAQKMGPGFFICIPSLQVVCTFKDAAKSVGAIQMPTSHVPRTQNHKFIQVFTTYPTP